MKMRELEHRTGVSREVIRIMLREGLLPEPVRPARNAAEYDEAHVRGVASIRQLQQSSRMTLKEIKAALDGGGFDRLRSTTTFAHLDSLLAGLFGLNEAPPVTLDTLQLRSPDARRDAAAFQKLGMLQIFKHDGQDAVGLADARLVDIWGQIREAGFVEEIGFPPENIAFYLDAARHVAYCEVETFLGNSSVPIEEGRAAEMLHTALPLMLDFFGLLRLKSFMKTLSSRLRVNNSDHRRPDEEPASTLLSHHAPRS